MGREERLAQNEVMFREVNERIREVSAHVGALDSGPEFLCECANEDCLERIRLSPAEYESLRSEPRRFVVLRGHETEIERVVADRGRYLIVEKLGEAGEIAERGDPR
jgi:hypothetical protein